MQWSLQDIIMQKNAWVNSDSDQNQIERGKSLSLFSNMTRSHTCFLLETMLATWKFIIVSDEELSPTRTKFCLNERNYKIYKLDDQPKRTRPDFSSFPVQSAAFVRTSYLTILILIAETISIPSIVSRNYWVGAYFASSLINVFFLF